MRIYSFLLTILLAASGKAQVGGDPWAGYDEAADLAILAGLDDEEMHYELLRSPHQRGAALWAAFEMDLDAFGAAAYESLKPIVLGASIAELQAAVDTGELSYESLTLFHLYRIREFENDPARYLNAVISLNPLALDQARARDAEHEANHDESHDPIFGMPILLKDNIGMAGLPTTAGAVALAENETGDAFITAMLRGRGAVLLGKANLSEWAYFFCRDCPSGWSAMGGQTLNPHGRLAFNTGGSSSGSGAAVAADYAVAAVGSETSGSILSPASANSLVGLKPTTGSLSRAGVVPISATLDTAGPMARSVADAVTLFNAMTGYDENDPAMLRLAQGRSLEYRLMGLAGKRIGALESMAEEAFYRQAANLLATNGAVIEDISLSWEYPERFGEFLGAEMVRDLAAYLADSAADAVAIASIADLRAFNLEDEVARAPYGQSLVEMMAELDHNEESIEALRAELQDTARSEMERLFAEHGLDALLSLNNFHAGIAALANFPALTIPAGYGEDGQPVGLTLIAPPFREQDLIDIGAEFERLSAARIPPADYATGAAGEIHAEEAAVRPRAREAGVLVGVFEPGPLNAITDVDGVRVGHSTVIRGDDIRTGVTAIIPAPGNLYTHPVPAWIHVGNGYGKLIGETQVREFGEIETPILLVCTLCVWSAANALKEWMYEQPGMGEHTLNPVVGETNDGRVNNMWADPVQRGEVYEALANASGGPVAEGSVGAGVGTQAFGWKGGIGTSSRRLPDELGGYTVGALVQTNYGGVLEINGAPVGRELGNYSFRAALEAENPDREDGSIMMVVATDAPLDSRALQRLSMRAMMGLARTGSFAGNGSGDYVIAFSANPSVRRPRSSDAPVGTEVLVHEALSPLFAATAEATEEAIYNAIFKATTVRSARGELRAIPLDELMPILHEYRAAAPAAN